MHTVQPIESLGDSQRRICTDAINGRNSQRFVVSGRRPGKCSYCDSGPTLEEVVGLHGARRDGGFVLHEDAGQDGRLGHPPSSPR
jgi:hypothetical protein